MNFLKLISLFCFLCFGCRQHTHTDKLPILGTPNIIKEDTLYPSIHAFSFIDQDSNVVTNQSFQGKIYIADFIFLSCPSICPEMNATMFDVYTFFENNPNILFLSHTIDPDKDSISRLKSYANNLGVSTSKWHFVTGNQDSIYAMAEKSYFSTAYKDSIAPGGFAHSGGLLLIDKFRHIRGVYDGTITTEKKRLINDINILLKEQF